VQRGGESPGQRELKPARHQPVRPQIHQNRRGYRFAATQTMENANKASSYFRLLSELTLASEAAGARAPKSADRAYSRESLELVSRLEERDLEELARLAMKNHVIMRAFVRLREMLAAGGNPQQADEAARAVDQEQARIQHALSFLELITKALDQAGCKPTVIKSLDHWPDLGSDLDLYIDHDSLDVIRVMQSRLGAKVASRSCGDRLAGKWNFVVPDLPELVEIHVSRLGQTGEQTALTQSLISHHCVVHVAGRMFRTTSPEDRIVISTLQRMYRHFYIRLCDIVDNARLIDAGVVDFHYLRSLGSETGLWEGIATYLQIVSEYVEAYRGHGLSLPSLVRKAARFGREQVSFGHDFLRVRILPHSATLYALELKKLVMNGELGNSLRLSLLPCLATAAAIEQKVTGTNKAVW
jgi:hypothetical protein